MFSSLPSFYVARHRPYANTYYPGVRPLRGYRQELHSSALFCRLCAGLRPKSIRKVLRSAPGGLAVFVSFLGEIGLVEAVRQHMPVCWKSPNYLDPNSDFHVVSDVRADERRAFRPRRPAARGSRCTCSAGKLERFPADDTIRNLLRKFGMCHAQRLFEPVTERQMER